VARFTDQPSWGEGYAGGCGGYAKGSVFDREKIFSSRRVTPPASSGFRALGKAGSPQRRPWSLAAILSILFALAGLRYAIHNWHHPNDPSPLALPLLAIAILLGAWNRFRHGRD
jgi:hypothetical protein